MASAHHLNGGAAATNTNTSRLTPAGSSSSSLDIYPRLRSFCATTWFGKPPQLSAMECASKGWSNTGPDQLTCHACGSQVLCKLPLNPWSDEAAGIVDKYARHLIDAHSSTCRQRTLLGLDQAPAGTAAGAAAGAPLALTAAPHASTRAGSNSGSSSSSSSSVAGLGFPILPAAKLHSAYSTRLQELQQLQFLPQVPASTRARLATAGARLDPTILSGLAAVLQVPVDALKHEAAAVVTAGSAAAAAAGGALTSPLPHEQSQLLVALCGWQVNQLLPQHLAPAAAAADAGGSIFGVAHLLPRRGQSSSSSAGHGSSAGGASAGSVSPACTALECELCGSQVGLWKFSCSGPFYAQQLSSKAMRALAATAAVGSTAPAQTGDAAPAQAAASDGGKQQQQQVNGTAAAGGPSHGSLQQQQQQQQPWASPEAVFSQLTHTIAGGSLLTAGASGGAGSGIPLGSSSFTARGPSPGAHSGGPFGSHQQQPFGSAAPQPAFGSSPAGLGSVGKPPLRAQSPAAAAAAGSAGGAGVGGGGGSRLFEGLHGMPAASLFGSPPPPAPVAAAGPFGSGGGGLSGGGAEPAAAAPVFGLQAFDVEEQQAKRRRLSAAGSDFAVAAAAAVAAHTAAGAAGAATPAGDASTPSAAATAAAAGQRPGTPSTPAAAGAGAASGGAAAGAGGGSGGRVRSYSKQRSGLVAAVAAVTGEAGAAESAVFDPIAAHKAWCPWVKESSRQPLPGTSSSTGNGLTNTTGSGSSAGLVAAVRVGWAATVMALQESLEQQQLEALVRQQQQQEGGGGGVGEGGLARQRDDYSSTAAVLARARQTMEMLESRDSLL